MKIHALAVEGAELSRALDALLAVEPHLDYANFAPVAQAAAIARVIRWYHTSRRPGGSLRRGAGFLPERLATT